MDPWVPLTEQEYDDTYCEAVRILREKYQVAANMQHSPKGELMCQIEGGLRVDTHTVLLLAWGAAITAEIEHERVPMKAHWSQAGTEWLNAENGFDQEWLSGFLLRWISAERYLALEQPGRISEGHLMEVLVKRDIPMLLSELARTRPDLSFRAEN